MSPEEHAAAAQTAAEERLEALWAREFDDEEGEVDSAGPFCGCVTCEVREVLDAAYPHLMAIARWEVQS